jgi:hypothetical protein
MGSHLQLYQQPLTPNLSPLAGLSQVRISPSFTPSPVSNQPASVSLDQPSPPTHDSPPTTQPIHAPPQIYTNPIISLPSSPFHIHSSQPSHTSYQTAPFLHPLPTRTLRSSTRHHPYERKSYVSASHGVSHSKEVYPSPFSELSQISGHKRVAVSEASELFSSPSKRLAPYSTIQDRMLLAAHSLTDMKNAPTAPPTPILQRVSAP